jgi:AraC-like DNA-binding protein
LAFVRDPETKQLSTLPSTAGLMTRLACARACAAGIDLEPLLNEAGLTRGQIEDRGARVDAQDQIRLVELAAHALQDDFLGFHLGRDFDLRETGLLYYVLASSELLGDALQRVARYSAIANEAVSLCCVQGNDIALVFNYLGVARHSDRHQIECWMTALVRTCRQLTGQRLLPSRVKFMHRRSEDCSEFSKFLGCSIVFGADTDEIAFPKTIGRMPVVSADHYLNELLIKYCDDALSHRRAGQADLRLRLENAIAPLLPHGEARAEDVARRLGMSQRTLARRLSAEGLTFTGVLDHLRSDLAKRYVSDPDLSISQIAWLLGYQEVSAFTHAYKRWTGKTPREMRAQAGFSASANPALDASL